MTTEDFTPPEDRIRECYHLGYGHVAREVTDAEFDRWLDAHNERVRAEAVHEVALLIEVERDRYIASFGVGSSLTHGLFRALSIIPVRA